VTSTSPARVIFFALFPFACGYFSSQLLRAVNAIIAPNLIVDFAIGPAELGFLTSAYLLTFSLFQLPLGVFLDRYGARRVQTILLLIASAGCLAFSAATSFSGLVLARAIIGLGFSAGLMASYKSSSLWVPLEHRSLANASIMSMGALGIVVSTEPTAWLVDALGWRGTFVCFAAVIAAAACFIFFAVPEKSQTERPASLAKQWREMWSILKLPLFWRVAPMLGITAGLHIAYQTLWVGPWFRDVAAQNPDQVARSLFWLAVAFMFGSLALGILADWLQRRGVGPMQTLNGLLVLHTAAQVLLVFAPPHWAFVGWLLLAGTGQAGILAYSWFASQVGESLSGRANAAINFAMFITAFAAQFVVGYIISLFDPTPKGYSPEGYASAFGTFLALQILAIAWYAVSMRKKTLT
jgi:predicted MFS family arabinose efflux permease